MSRERKRRTTACHPFELEIRKCICNRNWSDAMFFFLEEINFLVYTRDGYFTSCRKMAKCAFAAFCCLHVGRSVGRSFSFRSSKVFGWFVHICLNLSCPKWVSAWTCSRLWARTFKLDSVSFAMRAYHLSFFGEKICARNRKYSID